MTNVTYSYDSTSGGNIGKGRRTGMSDGSGAMAWNYDTRGRLVQETRTADSVNYSTSYTYDSADRVLTVTYPTGEVVTAGYNGRGLPYSVGGSVAGSLVTSTLYNQLGEVTRINLGNGTYSTFTYYGLDNSSGYYGKPWQTKTTKTTDGDRQSLTYTWDANSNLTQRQNSVSGETETFTYDFLDRLTAVSGAYSNSFSYSTIGNMTAKNGTSYTYGTKPHAVTAVGSTSYAYDANGNMTTRGSQTLTWDVENRVVGVTGGGVTMSAVYDGDGSRVKKTEGGETVLYANQYFEKNLTTGVVTTHYYLGGREVAYRKGTTLEYVCQDHLGSTSVTTDTSGNVVATIAYFPFGATRTSSGTLNTDELFTGQKIDQTGLYYYGARYYDASIGRFISADSIVQSLLNPQSLNRYSYCINNPLKYVDPSGLFIRDLLDRLSSGLSALASRLEPPPPATVSVTNVQLGAAVGEIFVSMGDTCQSLSYGPYALGPYVPDPKHDNSGGLLSGGDAAKAGGVWLTASSMDGFSPVVDVLVGVACIGYLGYTAYKNYTQGSQLTYSSRPKIQTTGTMRQTPSGYKPPPYRKDPQKPPGPDWKWKVGNWVRWNSAKAKYESVSSDTPHGKYGWHNDWKALDGKWYRVWPDGTISPK